MVCLSLLQTVSIWLCFNLSDTLFLCLNWCQLPLHDLKTNYGEYFCGKAIYHKQKLSSFSTTLKNGIIILKQVVLRLLVKRFDQQLKICMVYWNFNTIFNFLDNSLSNGNIFPKKERVNDLRYRSAQSMFKVLMTMRYCTKHAQFWFGVCGFHPFTPHLICPCHKRHNSLLKSI